MQLPIMPIVKPMLAKPVSKIPSACLYEPKWDGFRAIIFRDGDELEISSRNGRPMTRYFPELVDSLQANIPPRCVLDGEIVVVDPAGQGLDFEALQMRLHPAESRVRLLAEQTPSCFVAFDALALDDVDLTNQPQQRRRELLEQALAEANPPIYVTPATTDTKLAEDWFYQYEGAGLDGIIAKPMDLQYRQDKRVMFKIKHERTADCVVAGYRVHKATRDGIGSLLLGLYDNDGRLASVGVVGAFTTVRRRELFSQLQPLVTDLSMHPWGASTDSSGGPGADSADGAASATGAARRPEASRWSAGKDPSFVPLRPEKVVEVRYDYMAGERFRHTTQLVHWRRDRDPRSCTYEQLESPLPFDLREILPPT